MRSGRSPRRPPSTRSPSSPRSSSSSSTASGASAASTSSRRFTLDNYARTITSTLYQAVFLRTVAVGLAVAAARRAHRVRPGLPHALRRSSGAGPAPPRPRPHLLFSGYLVRIYAWRTILGREGILNSALLQSGVTSEPLTWLVYSNLVDGHHPLGDAHPASRCCRSGRRWRTSRATTWRVPRTSAHGASACIAPCSCRWSCPGSRRPSPSPSCSSAGDFVVPLLVGGTSGLLAGNLVADQFKGLGSDWPLGATLSFLIMAVMVARLPSLVTRRALPDGDPTGEPHGRSASSWPRVLLYLFLPVAVVVLFSFTTSPRLSLPIEGFTLDWYHAAFAEPLFCAGAPQQRPAGDRDLLRLGAPGRALRLRAGAARTAPAGAAPDRQPAPGDGPGARHRGRPGGPLLGAPAAAGPRQRRGRSHPGGTPVRDAAP